jgi:3-hydroxyanthranilate 3,4-dioxygenase
MIPTVGPPLNIQRWISENGHKLKPPVSNALLYRGQDYQIMIVGGPNARRDFHVNETEEWFYQLKGTVYVTVAQEEEGKLIFKKISITEGDTLLMPANVPHNPARPAETIGLVIERTRPVESIDRLRWYCEECHLIVYEESFHCTDLSVQLKPIIEKWQSDEKIRTCKCGFVNAAK